MNNSIVTTEQLKTVTGYTRPGDIERCLKKNGVKFLYGQGGNIFTTLDAINTAMGLKSQPTHDAIIEEIDFID